jgi:hypothetical protein
LSCMRGALVEGQSDRRPWADYYGGKSEIGSKIFQS